MSDTHNLDLVSVHSAYYSKVVACATKFLGGADAHDVAQEVFIKVSRSLGTLADPARLGGWIYAITLNTIRDFARKRRATPDCTNQSLPESGQDEAVADTQSRLPDEVLERQEMVTCYLDYVSALPPAYAEVYVLSEFEGLSDEQIAARLAVSRGAVKIRLHRARARLFESLRRDCECYRNRRGDLVGLPKRR